MTERLIALKHKMGAGYNTVVGVVTCPETSENEIGMLSSVDEVM